MSDSVLADVMTRIVTTHYRYKRPAGKRAKAASGAVRRPPFTGR